jgi:penicillin-binding protein 1B
MGTASQNALGEEVRLEAQGFAGVVRRLKGNPRAVWSLAACLAAAALLGVYAWGTAFDGLIRERLTNGPFQPPVRIRAAARVLSPGAPMKVEELVPLLQQAGYTDGGGLSGSYSVAEGVVTVQPGPNDWNSSEPARIAFEDGAIQSIETPDGRTLDAYPLTPVTLTRISDEGRTLRRLLTYDEIPANLRNAVIAIEDHRFFEHDGVDLMRTAKAAADGLVELRRPRGTSTLTQQLARGFFLTPEQTYSRKAKELTIARRLEELLTKEQIFEHYVNYVYMGRWGPFDVRGMGMAARRYFDRDISQLTTAQAATLAGLVQRPSYLDPDRFPERAIARRNQVIEAMRRYGYIEEPAYRAALAEPLGVVSRDLDTDVAPYFTALAERELRQIAPEQVQPFDIETTLDLDLQRMAVTAIEQGMQKVDKMVARQPRFRGKEAPKAQAALVALDPHTGEIKALVGGRDFEHSQLNRVLARRQPGSTFKPFVYAAALSTGLPGQATRDGEVITAATILPDTPRVFEFGDEQYQPRNFGHQSGFVTVREALAHSVNVPAVEVAERIGYRRVKELAQEVGLSSVRATPSAALGAYETSPLELAGAFTVFANGGRLVEPYFIREARVGQEPVYRAEPTSEQALDPRVAAIMVSLMEDVLNRGTGYRIRSAGFRGAAAGKTGTDDDGWFVGFTDKLLCLVWIGFDDNTDLGIEGGDSAAPIWAEFMKQANQLPAYSAARSFRRPSGLEESWVDVPARIADYQREQERLANVDGIWQTASLEEDEDYDPIPHREQMELFLPGTKPEPRRGFFGKLQFWKDRD